jgi:hypothetical protein
VLRCQSKLKLATFGVGFQNADADGQQHWPRRSAQRPS